MNVTCATHQRVWVDARLFVLLEGRTLDRIPSRLAPLLDRFLRVLAPWARPRPAQDNAAAESHATSLKRLRVEPKNYRVGPLLLRRFWKLAKPYWTRPGSWTSWSIYVLLIVLSVASTGAWAWSTKATADLTNAAVARNVGLTWAMLWGFGIAQIATYLLSAGSFFADSRLNLHWRSWLTRYLVERYLKRRTYYDIALREDLDNPDQRIQEDVSPFVQTISMFPRQVVASVLMLLTGGVILAGITPEIFWFVLAYAVAQTATTLFIYTPTIKQNYESTIAEADLRYGILHVRDNAETVAFYRGEYAEQAQIEERLQTAIKKQTIIINYSVVIQFVMIVFSYIWAIVPYLLLLPLFFDRRIEFGAIAQATMAASAMVQALSMLSNFVPLVTAAAPKAVRLAEILERFDAMDQALADTSIARLNFNQGPAIRLSKVSLETPGGEQALSRELSVAIEPGKNLVVIGQTGVGKSSILRAMAGLWSRGAGDITMPAADQCLFLPQRPYMILAELRSQLLYPHGDRERVSDEEICKALNRVRLEALLEKHGGLDAARDWGKVLSLGEQQRVAFARILISQPKFVFLDEATSAVDIDTESHLYGVMRQTGASYVSVGHRETILKYHDWALELFPGGTWKLMPIHEVIAFRAAGGDARTSL
jgi:putative ATP-binding cassette transporter